MASYSCKHPTCAAILKERGYCDSHKHLAPPKYDDSDKRYDREQRDKRSKTFYDSPEWDAARLWQLRHFPMCQRCNRKLATTVHHIRSVKEVRDTEPRLLTAGENLMSLCAPCHSRIEAQNGHRRYASEGISAR